MVTAHESLQAQGLAHLRVDPVPNTEDSMMGISNLHSQQMNKSNDYLVNRNIQKDNNDGYSYGVGEIDIASNGKKIINGKYIERANPAADLTINADKFSRTYTVNHIDSGGYPFTNPPLFDSTSLSEVGADGIPRRRRISISNGQIGQIINHEAIIWNNENPVEELFLMEGGPIPMMDQMNMPQNSSTQAGTSEANQSFASESPLHSAPIFESAGIPPQSAPADILQPINMQPMDVPTSNHPVLLNANFEFGGGASPMPGTAAWKKERLLERNRIAASKCRQRKKQAYKQLQESIAIHERELKSLKNQLQSCKTLLDEFSETGNEKGQETLDFIKKMKSIINQEASDPIRGSVTSKLSTASHVKAESFTLSPKEQPASEELK